MEVRFVDWASKIDGFQGGREKGVINRRRIFCFQAFKDAPFHFRRGYPAAFVEGQGRVIRRSVGDQSVQFAGKPLSNDFGYVQFGQKQSDDVINRRSANEYSPAFIVKKPTDVSVDSGGSWRLHLAGSGAGVKIVTCTNFGTVA